LIFILARHEADARSHTTPLYLDTRGCGLMAASSDRRGDADTAVAAGAVAGVAHGSKPNEGCVV